jgi:hypothetical protein
VPGDAPRAELDHWRVDSTLNTQGELCPLRPESIGPGRLLLGEVRMAPAQLLLWCLALIAAAVLIYILLGLVGAV